MIFPDVVGDSYRMTPVFAMYAKVYGQNSRKTQRLSARPRHTFEIAWPLMDETEAHSFEAHVLASLGAATTFEWWDWVVDFQWRWVPLGTGTGSSQLLDIPARLTTAQEFRHGKDTLIAGAVVSAGSGPDGRDRVTLTAPSGAKVWSTFNGQRLWKVGFDNDEQPLNFHLQPDGFCRVSASLVEEKL